jgi:hypothetical protein
VAQRQEKPPIYNSQIESSLLAFIKVEASAEAMRKGKKKRNKNIVKGQRKMIQAAQPEGNKIESIGL